MDPLGAFFFIPGSQAVDGGVVYVIPLEETRPKESDQPWEWSGIGRFPRVDKYAPDAHKWPRPKPPSAEALERWRANEIVVRNRAMQAKGDQ